MANENNMNAPALWAERLKNLLPDVLAVVFFLLLSFLYFKNPVSEGWVLSGHDNDASLGMAQDKVEYYEKTGEVSRWTNSLFSGMPTYQISPSYGPTDVLQTIADIYGLGTAGAMGYVFLYLLGFYILLRAFNFKVWLASLGAVVWAFSSYFFIIIAAGHIWKVLTLAFIPPTIAGMVLCYRGRLWWGGAVMALFTALQILSNHVQMSYYFLFVMFCISMAYGIGALVKSKDEDGQPLTVARWLKATGVLVVAGILGVVANLPNLYHTYQYSQESMRGKAELVSAAASGEKQAPADGLDFDYITGWSYGVGETFTLMIPDFKGGGSGESILDTKAAENHSEFLPMAQALAGDIGMNPPGISCYWGEQPGTVGPVYVGAIVCFLFVLGLFIVRGPLKWGLLVATMISLVFAWGRNIPDVAHFLIDHFPMYNKFRTVSSALVMAEFTIPLLAMLSLAQLLRQRDLLRQKSVQVFAGISLLLTAGVCALFWLFPGVAGNCITSDEVHFFAQLAPYQPNLSVNLSDYEGVLTAMRHELLSASAGRSLFFILAAGAVLLLYSRVKAFKGWMVCAALMLLCLTDMWQENKRYLNDDCFKVEDYKTSLVEKTAADEYILADTDPNFRVFDVVGFSGNRTGYYHKSVGGYHAAKLRRYQDLIERHIMNEGNRFVQAINQKQDALLADTAALLASGIQTPQGLYEWAAAQAAADSSLSTPVLNMLNTKYFIFGGGKVAVPNPAAQGNGWFVRSLRFVDGANEEMAALSEIDVRCEAVVDNAFCTQLDISSLDSGRVRLTSYAPNEIRYEVDSEKGGVVVFSEIYYPGWTATIDGQPAELGRANYVLRALRVPGGKHEVVLEFRPTSVTTTETVAYVSIALVMLAFVAALVLSFRKKKEIIK